MPDYPPNEIESIDSANIKNYKRWKLATANQPNSDMSGQTTSLTRLKQGKEFALLLLLGLFFSWFFLCGCKRDAQTKSSTDQASGNPNQDFFHKPEAVYFMSGQAFIRQLQQDGTLPGAWPNERGTLKAPMKPVEMSNGFSLTCTLMSITNSDLLNYSIFETSSNGPWRLERAWRTDKTGALISELPVNGSK